MSRSRKPSVFQVGKVRDDGRTVVISGWGLGLCAAGCACHRHPSAGHLAIAEDQAGGRLGLASYRDGGCDCCEPWTAEELAAILRDLETVAEPAGPGAARRLSRTPVSCAHARAGTLRATVAHARRRRAVRTARPGGRPCVPCVLDRRTP